MTQLPLQSDVDRIMELVGKAITYRCMVSRAVTDTMFTELRTHTNRALGQQLRRTVEKLSRHRLELSC